MRIWRSASTISLSSRSLNGSAVSESRGRAVNGHNADEFISPVLQTINLLSRAVSHSITSHTVPPLEQHPPRLDRIVPLNRIGSCGMMHTARPRTSGSASFPRSIPSTEIEPPSSSTNRSIACDGGGGWGSASTHVSSVSQSASTVPRSQRRQRHVISIVHRRRHCTNHCDGALPGTGAADNANRAASAHGEGQPTQSCWQARTVPQHNVAEHQLTAGRPVSWGHNERLLSSAFLLLRLVGRTTSRPSAAHAAARTSAAAAGRPPRHHFFIGFRAQLRCLRRQIRVPAHKKHPPRQQTHMHIHVCTRPRAAHKQ